MRWTAFDRWADRHRIDGDDFDFTWSMIRILDAVYLGHERERLQAAREPKDEI